MPSARCPQAMVAEIRLREFSRHGCATQLWRGTSVSTDGWWELQSAHAASIPHIDAVVRKPNGFVFGTGHMSVNRHKWLYGLAAT